MQRILKDTQATLSVTFSVDGTATNPAPDSATVTITRADGTVLVSSQAATDTGVGSFAYTLSAGQNNLLDVLTARWTSNLGTITTIAEVVGGFLFSISEARAVKPLNDTAKYSTQQIIDTRTLVEQAIEDACAVAFVPRYKRETINGRGDTTVMLSQPRVTALRSVARDGTALEASELASIVPAGAGSVYYPNRWTAGFGNYTVAYEHGYPYPPERVKHAALLWAKQILIQGPVSDRTTSMTTDDGTFALSTPGLRGAVAGIPEVDATIQSYRLDASVL